MARFLRDILLFLLFALPVYVGFTIAAGELELPGQNLKIALGQNGHMLTRLRERAQNKGHEVLVLGSSHAYRGFDPRIFARHGYRMFNLGSSIQGPIQTEAVLAGHLRPDVPQLTLIEVNPVAFQSISTESTLDLISNDHLTPRTLGLGLRTGSIVVWNTMIHAAYQQIVGITDTCVEPAYNHGAGDRYIPGGYVQRDHVRFRVRDLNKVPPTRWRPMKEQLDAFERCIDQLRAAGSKVVLVSAPVMPTQQYPDTAQARIQAHFAALAPFYDLSRSVPADTTLFYDAHHLRQPGVEIFNTELLRLLQADGHLDGVDRKLSE